MLVRQRISGISNLALPAAELSHAAFKWWFAELHDLIPTRVKTFFTGDGERLWIRIHENAIQVERADRSERWEFPIWNAGEVPASLREILRDGAGAVLFLPTNITLRRKVELPLATASELRSTTSFLIDRLTPFRAEQTYHSARLLTRDRTRKLLSAELIVVPRDKLDGIVRAVAAWGIPVSSVRVEGERGIDLHFKPERLRTAPYSWLSQQAWKSVLAAGLALLTLGPLIVAYRIHQHAMALKVEIAAEEVNARRAVALRSEVEARGAEQAFLPMRQRSLRPIETLDALTKALPDDSWLFSMELRPGQAVLAGFSSNVPGLVERLTRPPFVGPELTAPVVNGISGGKSRFELRVQVKDARS